MAFFTRTEWNKLSSLFLRAEQDRELGIPRMKPKRALLNLVGFKSDFTQSATFSMEGFVQNIVPFVPWELRQYLHPGKEPSPKLIASAIVPRLDFIRSISRPITAEAPQQDGHYSISYLRCKH